jgi:protein-tyrosine-phosphatase
VFAVVAASIGAVQLSKQLSHTKEKAANEAWWQQFEWVTDRVIAPAGQKSEADSSRLPTSLAFDLMTSLSKVARAPFQKDAVGGILEHYLKDFPNEGPEGPDEPKTTNRSGGRAESPATEGASMDSAAANSLRNLIDALPESSRPSASARRVLAAYDAENYEQEIAKALRHHGFDVTLPGMMKKLSEEHIGDADIIATIGNKKIIGDVKLSAHTPNSLINAGRYVQKLMKQEGATHGVIFTPPTNVAQLVVSELALQGIYVVLWEPNMRSFELKRQIDKVLEDTTH